MSRFSDERRNGICLLVDDEKHRRVALVLKGNPEAKSGKRICHEYLCDSINKTKLNWLNNWL